MSYFKPLRRKLGVVTLLLACVFMAGWVRSQSTYEQFTLDRKRFSMRFFTSHNLLGLQTFHLLKPSTKSHLKFHPLGYHKAVLQTNRQLFPSMLNGSSGQAWEIQRDLHLGDLRIAYARAKWNDISYIEARVPYLFIVAPLLAASAYLLLSKPRQPKQVPA